MGISGTKCQCVIPMKFMRSNYKYCLPNRHIIKLQVAEFSSVFGQPGIPRAKVDSKFWRLRGVTEPHPSDVLLRSWFRNFLRSNLRFPFDWKTLHMICFACSRTKRNMSDENFSDHVILYLPAVVAQNMSFCTLPGGMANWTCWLR